jgi:hypothetical protein
MGLNRNNYFCGIDPGATGGLGVIDEQGKFVAAHRWDKREPARLYNILLSIKEMIRGYIYLEMINAHPGQGLGHVVRNQSLAVNFGIWQGFLIAAGMDYLRIHPATWQTAHGLRNWQANADKGGPSPLALARSKWPGAPLDHKVDDGKAVGLLLASLALQDAQRGIDRRLLQETAGAKKTQAKKKAKAAKSTLLYI